MTPTVEATLPLIGLRQYARDDVKLWNLFLQLAGSGRQWQSVLRESFSGLLYRRATDRLLLREANLMDAAEAPQHVFEKDEVLIGRGPDNDVELDANVIGKRHARIYSDGAGYFLEDLGSSLGTHINGRKLLPHEPHPLAPRERFVIFPYTFEFNVEQAWVPETRVDVAGAGFEVTTLGQYEASAPLGFEHFELEIHPTGCVLRLSVARKFLRDLVSRALREAPDSAVAESDHGLFEFLLLAVLEKLNRRVSFPFQFVLRPAPMNARPDEPGYELAFSVGLSGATGAFRAFLPRELMECIQTTAAPPRDLSRCENVAWKSQVSLAQVGLTKAEFSGLEEGDVLLFKSAPELLLPDARRGWHLAITEQEPWRFRVEQYFERYFERNEFMETDTLPVHVQVVLGEIELTLAELGKLDQGSILELPTRRSDPVRLLANGKPAGYGELVEIDGALGVRITQFGGPHG